MAPNPLLEAGPTPAPTPVRVVRDTIVTVLSTLPPENAPTQAAKGTAVNPGPIIGGLVGGIGAGLLAIAFIWWYIRHRQRNREAARRAYIRRRHRQMSEYAKARSQYSASSSIYSGTYLKTPSPTEKSFDPSVPFPAPPRTYMKAKAYDPFSSDRGYGYEPQMILPPGAHYDVQQGYDPMLISGTEQMVDAPDVDQYNQYQQAYAHRRSTSSQRQMAQQAYAHSRTMSQYSRSSQGSSHHRRSTSSQRHLSMSGMRVSQRMSDHEPMPVPMTRTRSQPRMSQRTSQHDPMPVTMTRTKSQPRTSQSQYAAAVAQQRMSHEQPMPVAMPVARKKSIPTTRRKSVPALVPSPEPQPQSGSSSSGSSGSSSPPGNSPPSSTFPTSDSDEWTQRSQRGAARAAAADQAAANATAPLNKRHRPSRPSPLAESNGGVNPAIMVNMAAPLTADFAPPAMGPSPPISDESTDAYAAAAQGTWPLASECGGMDFSRGSFYDAADEPAVQATVGGGLSQSETRHLSIPPDPFAEYGAYIEGIEAGLSADDVVPRAPKNPGWI